MNPSSSYCGDLSLFSGRDPVWISLCAVRLGKDIRTMGSGNIGATNVHRSAGGSQAGVAVLLLDIAKGFFAVWLAALMTHNSPEALALSAVAVMLGHAFPVLLRFRGRQGSCLFYRRILVHCSARIIGSVGRVCGCGRVQQIHLSRIHCGFDSFPHCGLADHASRTANSHSFRWLPLSHRGAAPGATSNAWLLEQKMCSR